MIIYVACADAGDAYTSIVAGIDHWACSTDWDEITRLALSRDIWLCFIYAFDLAERRCIQRYEYQHASGAFEVWSE